MKKRLDIVLVERGLAQSRHRAQGLIMSGKVTVGGHLAAKAGLMVEEGVVVEVEESMPFVSRGGLKLEAALAHYGLDVAGKVVMDVGASTGGFTDCLLKRGARRVYAVDVGYGLIDASLRGDRRVVLLERTNFRYLSRDAVPECVDMATADVSFISLAKIFPRLIEFLCGAAEVLALVKPQFEVGRERVGRGGIVRDEDARMEAVAAVRRAAEALGFVAGDPFESPVRGQKGNREYFLLLRWSGHG